MPTFVIKNSASPELRRLAARAANPVPGLMVAGRAVVNLLKRHFRNKDRTEPNALGGKRTHYWRGVADAVNSPQPASAAAIRISISHPTIAQKIFGGVIRAKRTRFLTIPVRAEAHGRTAATLEHELGLKLFVRVKRGRAWLAARTSKSALRVFYLLKRSVRQDRDPAALPPDQQILTTATDYFGRWLARSQAAQ